MLLDFLEL